MIGWAIQFVGHVFEGRKPAFLDDLRGLLDGPLFLVAETAFALGLSPELREEVERRAGPTRWGKIEAPTNRLAAAPAHIGNGSCAMPVPIAHVAPRTDAMIAP